MFTKNTKATKRSKPKNFLLWGSYSTPPRLINTEPIAPWSYSRVDTVIEQWALSSGPTVFVIFLFVFLIFVFWIFAFWVFVFLIFVFWIFVFLIFVFWIICISDICILYICILYICIFDNCVFDICICDICILGICVFDICVLVICILDMCVFRPKVVSLLSLTSLAPDDCFLQPFMVIIIFSRK